MLKLHRIQLNNWRNQKHLDLTFSPSLTVLVGPNATGKTNTLEAIQLLCSAQSFRHTKPEQFVLEGTDNAEALLDLTEDMRAVNVGVRVIDGKRHFFRMGKKANKKEITQDILPVLFVPDDLSLVKQSAQFRRDELDTFASLAHYGYAVLLKNYTKALAHRNAVLKDWPLNEALLSVLDNQLSSLGAQLLIHRVALFYDIARLTHDIYASVAGGEDLTLEYESSLTSGELPRDQEAWQELFYKRLQEIRDEDVRLRQTTVGPHRDNYRFDINNKDARSYASQGQQRSAVLAFKFAQVAFTLERLSKTPVLLLDDVMSELDETRRQAVCDYIQKGIQTVITTINLQYFNQDMLQDAVIVHFH